MQTMQRLVRLVSADAFREFLCVEWERSRTHWELQRLARQLRVDDGRLADLLTDRDGTQEATRRLGLTYLWGVLLCLSGFFLLGGLLLDLPAADFLGLAAAVACYLMRPHTPARSARGSALTRRPRDLRPQ
jgi:hypothetical protein